MKIYLTAALILISMASLAQDVRLENLWTKGSDKIYTGVNNYFRMDGNFNAITKIDANAGVQRQHDTLLVMPSSGRVNITIFTPAGKTNFTYEAIEFPLPSLQFFCVDLKKVSPIVKVKAQGDLYSNYQIIQYTILIDGRERTSHTDYLTSEVLSAIDKIPPGKNFEVKHVVFWNKETDHYLDVEPGLHFELDYTKKGGNNFTNTCIADYIIASVPGH
jgi:hypothetical protein